MTTTAVIRKVEKAWAKYVGQSRVEFAIAIPEGATVVEHWGYDYASCVKVYRAPDGTIVADCQGRECSGWEARHHRIRVANLESWNAYKHETGDDREWHLPNGNPAARRWEFVDMDAAATGAQS